MSGWTSLLSASDRTRPFRRHRRSLGYSQDDVPTAFLRRTGCCICCAMLSAKPLKMNQVEQWNFRSRRGGSVMSRQPKSQGQAHPGPIGTSRPRRRIPTPQVQCYRVRWRSGAPWRDLEKPDVGFCGVWSCHPPCSCEYVHRAVPPAIAASSPEKDLVEFSFSVLRMTYQAPFFF